MWETWNAMKNWEGIAMTIDRVGRYGVCVWDDTITKAKHYDLASYTDFWREGRPRVAGIAGSVAVFLEG